MTIIYFEERKFCSYLNKLKLFENCFLFLCSRRELKKLRKYLKNIYIIFKKIFYIFLIMFFITYLGFFISFFFNVSFQYKF